VAVVGAAAAIGVFSYVGVGAVVGEQCPAGVVSKGLSPISSSMTSFPAASSCLAIVRTVNAVSALTELAKSLKEAGISAENPLGLIAFFHRQPSLCPVAADAGSPNGTRLSCGRLWR
jgi:hypothetical protein